MTQEVENRLIQLKVMMRRGYEWRTVCDFMRWSTLDMRQHVHLLAQYLRAQTELKSQMAQFPSRTRQTSLPQ